MKVKMLEYYQGVNVSAVSFPGRETVTILVPGNAYEVDDSMGQWLLENRKAEELKEPLMVAHYATIKESPKEPEAKPRGRPRKA